MQLQSFSLQRPISLAVALTLLLGLAFAGVAVAHNEADAASTVRVHKRAAHSAKRAPRDAAPATTTLNPAANPVSAVLDVLLDAALETALDVPVAAPMDLAVDMPIYVPVVSAVDTPAEAAPDLAAEPAAEAAAEAATTSNPDAGAEAPAETPAEPPAATTAIEVQVEAPAEAAAEPTAEAPAETSVEAPPDASAAEVPAQAPSEFDQFVASVVDGRAGVLRGVYVPGVLAMRIVQQPSGAPYYVDMSPGVATQYGAASSFGVTGLLADNLASGVLFYGLSGGQEVHLVFGDGATRRYVVSAAYRYQALSPRDPYSDFVDLATGARLSATSLFSQMYAGGDKVVFQTCIAQDGLAAWGRLFVVALPAN